ncbi:MAG TPA: hypothetical protein VGL39_26945 [Jatrophihabitantaceae bacterium]
MVFTLVSVLTGGTGAALLARWMGGRGGQRHRVTSPDRQPLPPGPGLSPATVATSALLPD